MKPNAPPRSANPEKVPGRRLFQVCSRRSIPVSNISTPIRRSSRLRADTNAIVCLDVIEHLPLIQRLALLQRMTHLHRYNPPDLWSYLTLPGYSVTGCRVEFRPPKLSPVASFKSLASWAITFQLLGCDYADDSRLCRASRRKIIEFALICRQSDCF